jgi:membrane-bound ClpP family serine protease
MNSLRESFLRPELIWFLVGLLLLFVEMAIPGFVIGFFALGAWIVAVVALCRPREAGGDRRLRGRPAGQDQPGGG